EHHVVSLEWRAIVEFDVLAQRETPYGGRGLFPSSGQRRRKFERFVVLDQRFVHIAGACNGQPLVLGVRIQCQDVALACPMRRLGRGSKREEYGSGDGGGYKHTEHEGILTKG